MDSDCCVHTASCFCRSTKLVIIKRTEIIYRVQENSVITMSNCDLTISSGNGFHHSRQLRARSTSGWVLWSHHDALEYTLEFYQHSDTSWFEKMVGPIRLSTVSVSVSVSTLPSVVQGRYRLRRPYHFSNSSSVWSIPVPPANGKLYAGETISQPFRRPVQHCLHDRWYIDNTNKDYYLTGGGTPVHLAWGGG